MATFNYGPYYRSGIQAKEKQRKAITGQGYTPEELAGMNYGELMAKYQEQEARRTREENKTLQEKGLSLQEQGLLSQEKYQTGQLGLKEKELGAQERQYASSLGLQEKELGAQSDWYSRQLKINEQKQKSAEKAATVSGVATGVNVLDKLGVLSWGKKAITSGFAPAVKEATTYSMSELPEAAGWVEEGAGFFEGAYKTVSDVVSSGTVICTELYSQGLLDSEIYMADSAFGALFPEDVLIGYKIWAVKIVRLMRKSPIFTKIVALFAIPWAKEMAFRFGVGKKGNLFGGTMLFIGIPICRTIGRLLMAKGGRFGWAF